jgi:hypothetical protein
LKITHNNKTIQKLEKNPIFLLTGDIETTKFYSSLASACIKIGTYLEDKIEEKIRINFDIKQEIGQQSLFPTEEYFLVKQKFQKVEPDFVYIDENQKIIYVYEVKTNLGNADSKKAHGEKIKYKTLYTFLTKKYLDYTVKIFVVDFMGDLSGATALYEASDIIEVIDGETFCKRIKIDYQTIINDLKLSQNHNKNFIKEFKKIEVC